MKSSLLPTLLVALALLTPGLRPALAQEGTPAPAPAPEPVDEGEVLYALGLAVAQSLAQFNLTPDEFSRVQAGIKDGVLDKKSVDLQKLGPQIQAMMQERIAKQGEMEAKEAEKFLTEMAAKDGVEKTASGLLYSEIKAGDGKSPAATDTVKVHYHGTLRDGSVFDSSVERNNPATFRLNQVIPCWTEGLQKMKAGGKSRLVCPPAIAYGDRGAPPKILPNSALVFEVELLEVLDVPPKPPVPPPAGEAPPSGDAPANESGQ